MTRAKLTTDLIDADVHPVLDNAAVGRRLPEPWRTRWRAGKRGPGHLGYWNPTPIHRPDAVMPDGSRIEGTPENLAAGFFDVYGLSYGILNPAMSLAFGVSPEPDFAAAACSAINDTLAEDWLPVDERFRGSITVSPVDPHLAAKEIRRHGRTPGMVQVYMTSAARMPYGQRFYWPIYEAACEMGLPVGIHPGMEGCGISNPPSPAGYPTSYFEWHTALACNYIGHLISLVSEGVFQQFPTLKFVLIEGGMCWVPPILWRFDKNWKALRMTAPWLDRKPSEVVADHFRLTTQPIEEPEDKQHFRAMLEMFPAERMLMFSTDFPHWDGDTPDFAATFFPASMRSRVMSENARELFKLPAPEASKETAHA